MNSDDLDLFFPLFATPGLVATLNPKNKVDLTKPNLTIIIEVIKAVCCISVVKDYSLYKKYNVQEVIKEDGPAAPTESEAAEQVETTEKGEKDGENTDSRTAAEDDKPEEKDGCDADQ